MKFSYHRCELWRSNLKNINGYQPVVDEIKNLINKKTVSGFEIDERRNNRSVLGNRWGNI